MGVPEGDTAIMGGQAKSTSGSHDSHSIELLGSTTELNQKLLQEAAQAESSIHQKVQTIFLSLRIPYSLSLIVPFFRLLL